MWAAVQPGDGAFVVESCRVGSWASGHQALKPGSARQRDRSDGLSHGPRDLGR